MIDKNVDGKLSLMKKDNIFKRMTKSKMDYVEEGMVLCGKYYSVVLAKMKKDYTEQKELLHNRLHEKDVLVKILKDQVHELKEKYAQREHTTEEELMELLQVIYQEDQEILLECSKLEKEYNNEEKVSNGGMGGWSF